MCSHLFLACCSNLPLELKQEKNAEGLRFEVEDLVQASGTTEKYPSIFSMILLLLLLLLLSTATELDI